MEDHQFDITSRLSVGTKSNVALKSKMFPDSNAELADHRKKQPTVKLPELMKPRRFQVSPAPTSETTFSRQIITNKKHIVRRLSESMSTTGLINQKDGLTKLATNSINVQTRNVSKVIKRQHDACTNIHLPEDAELQLRVVFKQFCEKKHIKGSEIDVVHINKIRQMFRSAGDHLSDRELQDLLLLTTCNSTKTACIYEGNAWITYDEFLGLVAYRLYDESSEEELVKAFRAFDETSDGVLQESEIRKVLMSLLKLGPQIISKHDVDSLMKDLSDPTGQINFHKLVEEIEKSKKYFQVH